MSPKILVKTQNGATLVYELKSGRNTLGRSAAADFQILDPAVSGLHCELALNGGQVQLRDLGSTNGTFINGDRIRETTLRSGETFFLGAVQVGFEQQSVNVSIPERPRPSAGTPVLPDGTRGCENHPGLAADRECLQCGKTFCETCIHVIRRQGGEPLFLCPSCSGHCVSLAPTAGDVTGIRAFFGRLFGIFQRSASQ